MLDRRFVLENIDAVRDNCERRGIHLDLSRFVSLEEQRKRLQQQVDDLNRSANELAKSIPKAAKEEKPALIEQGKTLRTQRAEAEQALQDVVQEADALLAAIPNMSHPESPAGGEEDSREIGRGKTPLPAYAFQPKDHVELGEALDLIDLEAGAKVAGHGFYFLRNEAVLLDMALQSFALHRLVQEGFTLVSTPDLARNEVLAGTGYVPRGPETQIYSIADSDLSLIATSEITLAGMLSGKILEQADLPILLCGHSHCFRTEAGAHGRASRGLYRVHQFTKVEMFAFTTPDASAAMHERLKAIECQLFDDLGIPYRILDIATGDLGAPAYRKYDLEAWMPGRGEAGEFGEVTSTSNCTDYQARRLNIRYRPQGGGRPQHLHMLNGTAVATSRALIAVLENYQQADGSIQVPEVLRPYVGKDVIGPR
ncbi:serine--tRNA ligase [Aquibaculum arenosum]|uniref:Serine--tRNA ligase n=1 Tax=Aquibaculum arenosum TaxID=3032591 RepID=A0ABT5YK92_9PROT|nr:serine--tRNA ligase [Fodinicurvata sp. CAU 1616]MDF2095344.1 serine--tRNA ligase [Fodinicurvata sp. CAU 1616]